MISTKPAPANRMVLNCAQCPWTLPDGKSAVFGRGLITIGSMVRGWFGLTVPQPATIHHAPKLADRARWVFDWPDELLAHEPECDTADFVRWLRKHGQLTLSRRELVSLYFEFIELTEMRPVTGWHRFDLSLKPAGFLRVRSSTGSRPWLYQLSPSKPSLVLKQPRCPAPSLERRAA